MEDEKDNKNAFSVDQNVRKGVTNAKFNDSASSLFFAEIFILSVIIGAINQSWGVFGVTFIVIFVMSMIRQLMIILMVILTITWSILGLSLGMMLGGWVAAVSFGVIALAASAGIHMGAYEWTQDMSK